MRAGVSPSNIHFDLRWSTLRPHFVEWLSAAVRCLTPELIIRGFRAAGLLNAWLPDFQREAVRIHGKGELWRNAIDISTAHLPAADVADESSVSPVFPAIVDESSAPQAVPAIVGESSVPLAVATNREILRRHSTRAPRLTQRALSFSRSLARSTHVATNFCIGEKVAVLHHDDQRWYFAVIEGIDDASNSLQVRFAIDLRTALGVNPTCVKKLGELSDSDKEAIVN